MFELLLKEIGWVPALLLLLGLTGLFSAARDPQLRLDLRGAALLVLGYLGLWGLALALPADAAPARWAKVGAYLLFAFAVVRAGIGLALWLVRRRTRMETPKILRQVINALLYLVATAVVLRATIKVDLGGLLTTSAIVSVVIGLALQETLGNLFAGLSVQLERPFKVGDWITVGSFTGRVAHVTWRATRMVTGTNEQVTIPNSVIGKESVTNHSLSREGVAKDVFIELDYDSPPNAVRSACLEVLAEHPKVRKSPAPIFRVSKWEASGVQYQVRFYVTDFGDLPDVTAEILSQLWYRVRREGFSIPFPTRTVFLQRPPGREARDQERRELVRLLAKVDFLAPLGAEGLERLVALSHLELFGAGETVIREGEPGDSFYVVVDGEVAVEAKGAVLARLARGDFFGEMSLLTGEPRSATVRVDRDSRLLRLERPAFAPLLESSPDLARALSETLARRSGELRAKAVGAEHPGAEAAESSRIFAKLRGLFALG